MFQPNVEKEVVPPANLDTFIDETPASEKKVREIAGNTRSVAVMTFPRSESL
jgi:hypothetical protein